MEIFERKENLKNPVGTAQRNSLALSFLYIVIGLFFIGIRLEIGMFIVSAGVLLLIIARLLGKRKIAGVYLGWIFVIFATAGSIYGGGLLNLLIVAYFGFWNYKAQQAIKSPNAVENVQTNSTVPGQ